ncbi:hypothetical protein AGMMS49965_26520 [Bacteroidia bacterium]|nr:hypothetical protein AGMMS49965_26520 [Bacteroidia bacterium]
MVGFSELNNAFNLNSVIYGYDGFYYCNSGIIAYSLKNKISEVTLNYSSDTTFLYQGNPGGRIYDGNSYVFIFQTNSGSYLKIYFEPQFLPDDLTFLYNCLYKNRQENVQRNQYTPLFNEFESIIMSGENIIPPAPILKETP